ncbi:MAG TPA: polysaccharide ABC transporter ATP-binding protein [Pyrinomonadaceae bacterium]|nr:polysaccharide ABC transporter ATP-binding protein [Pyrinomonadaceae bacterium]
MSNIPINVEGLGKRYRIGAKRQGYETLREKFNEAALAPFRAMMSFAGGNGRNGHKSKAELIWALKDVSFEIKGGEVVGIIGRNGAGKSTLLKILSRITEPTEGYADINGRVGSLLEVGTGFHPELTGRENIFLNGSILGMKRAEIKKKFDEMVAFAEVEKFIDTPVKHYSSGMYVRLAFAVAAHLDPEILLVDEVLAVGDIAFQEKCLGKMGDAAKQGRTVLFVSHNLGAIQRLCSDAILLDGGIILSRGRPEQIVQNYLGLMKAPPSSVINTNHLSIDVRTLDAAERPTIVWRFGERLIIDVLVSTPEVLRRPSVDIGVYTGTRTPLFSLRSDRLATAPLEISGKWTVRFEIDNPGITAPEMVFDVGIREGNNGYRKMIPNAGSLSADHETLPPIADSDWMLFTKACVTWEGSGLSQSAKA